MENFAARIAAISDTCLQRTFRAGEIRNPGARRGRGNLTDVLAYLPPES